MHRITVYNSPVYRNYSLVLWLQEVNMYRYSGDTFSSSTAITWWKFTSVVTISVCYNVFSVKRARTSIRAHRYTSWFVYWTNSLCLSVICFISKSISTLFSCQWCHRHMQIKIFPWIYKAKHHKDFLFHPESLIRRMINNQPEIYSQCVMIKNGLVKMCGGNARLNNNFGNLLVTVPFW